MIFNVCVTKYSALNKFLRPFYLCSFNVHINVAPTTQKFDLNLLQTTKINISESETDVSSLFACWLKQSCYLAIIIIFRLSNKKYSSFVNHASVAEYLILLKRIEMLNRN